MIYAEFQQNIAQFSSLLNEIKKAKMDNPLIKHHIEQHVIVLNGILSTCIKQLKALSESQQQNELIGLIAMLTEEMHHKLTVNLQNFLNVSLNQIAHYNEALKAQSDLVTD